MKQLLFILLMIPAVALSQQVPGKLLKTAVREYDTASGAIVRHDSITYTYSTGGGDPSINPPHLYDTELTLRKTTGNFDSFLRNTQTFNGNDVTRILEYWDKNINTWSPPVKYEEKYDTSGNVIERKYSKWINNQWELQVKSLWLFDANNNLTFTQLNRYYSNIPGLGSDSNRRFYYYTGIVLDSSLAQTYNKGWRDTARVVEYHIDTSHTVRWGIDKKGSSWDTTHKSDWYYNNNRAVQKIINGSIKMLSGGGYQWTPNREIYYVYDSSGNLLVDSSKNFISSSSQFENYIKIEITYNSFNQAIYGKRHVWNAGSNSWRTYSDVFYYYETKPSTSLMRGFLDRDIVLYPNPASIELKVIGKEGVEYSVYSLEGRLINKGINMGAIDIADLSSGSYHIIFSDGVSTSFIKQ